MQTNNTFSFNHFSTIDTEEELQTITGGFILTVAAVGCALAGGQLILGIYNAGYQAGKDRANAGKAR
jgi:lactobin A/cerein 7B family class IIb bacteriocin